MLYEYECLVHTYNNVVSLSMLLWMADTLPPLLPNKTPLTYIYIHVLIISLSLVFSRHDVYLNPLMLDLPLSHLPLVNKKLYLIYPWSIRNSISFTLGQ